MKPRDPRCRRRCPAQSLRGGTHSRRPSCPATPSLACTRRLHPAKFPTLPPAPPPRSQMVGFTPLSAARGPEEVLGILSELFADFDQAVRRPDCAVSTRFPTTRLALRGCLPTCAGRADLRCLLLHARAAHPIACQPGRHRRLPTPAMPCPSSRHSRSPVVPLAAASPSWPVVFHTGRAMGGAQGEDDW